MGSVYSVLDSRPRCRMWWGIFSARNLNRNTISPLVWKEGRETSPILGSKKVLSIVETLDSSWTIDCSSPSPPVATPGGSKVDTYSHVQLAFA
jgi:hypothetical protein